MAPYTGSLPILPGKKSLDERLFGGPSTEQLRLEAMEKGIAHGAPKEKKAAALEAFMASQSSSTFDEGDTTCALNEVQQMMQETGAATSSKGKGVENQKPVPARDTLPASEGIKLMQGREDDYDYPDTFKPQRDPTLKKEKYATPEVLAKRPMLMPARRRGTPKVDTPSKDATQPQLHSSLATSIPSAEGQLPYVAPQKKQKPHPTLTGPKNLNQSSHTDFGSPSTFSSESAPPDTYGPAAQGSTASYAATSSSTKQKPQPAMTAPKDLNPNRYRSLGSASALANKPAPPDPYGPAIQESTVSYTAMPSSATPSQNPTSGSSFSSTPNKVPASRYAATYAASGTGPSQATGISSASGPSMGNPSQPPVPAPQVYTSYGQRLLYEGQYLFTGTAEDVAYLREFYMNIEDKDVDAFIRRYYRLVHGNGASAVASPDQNDQEAAREGCIVLLTKWQTVHQTRLGVGAVESSRNGTLVGGRIAIRAFETGHATLLKPIVDYFDRMVKDCEEQANVLPRHEFADFHKWGEMSWVATLKRDFNFFTSARDRITHAVRLEQQRREGENKRFQSQAMGPGNLAGRVGSSVASTPRLGNASFAGSQTSTGGHTSPLLGPDGRPKDHGFPADIVVSSDIRSIPARSGASSSAASPGRAESSDDVGGYAVKNSTGKAPDAEGMVPL